jgi:putative N6-adenine-specific DNA methylase
MQSFFLACNLGLEAILEEELNQVFPYLIGKDGRPQSSGYKIIQIEKGGIEIATELELGLQLNFFLKTCGRILFRIAEGKMVEFFHLEAWLKRNSPKQWAGECKFSYEVAASQSKLGHEKRLIQTLEKAFGPNEDSGQKLFLRIFQDRAQLSLDTTGEHLHFRGYRQEQGVAPLRETLAAALVLQFVQGFSLPELKSQNLFDPFCGSGTLLIEADSLFSPTETRSFAFQKWQKIPALFKSESFLKNYRGIEKLRWQSLRGLDIDASVIAKAKANSERAGADIQLTVQDSLRSELNSAKPLWIFSNPPYGERVQGQSAKGEQLLIKTIEKYRPQRAGFLVPESWQLKCDGYKTKQALTFKNGGLPVQFLILEKLVQSEQIANDWEVV